MLCLFKPHMKIMHEFEGSVKKYLIRVEFCRHHVCYFSSATVNKESFCIEKILLHRLSAAHQSNAETMTFTRIVLSIRRKDFAILKYMHFIEEKSEHEKFFKNYLKHINK